MAAPVMLGRGIAAASSGTSRFGLGMAEREPIPTMREETFALKVTRDGAQGGSYVLSGDGTLIVETIDALLMDPNLRSFSLERSVPPVTGYQQVNDAGDDPATTAA